MFTHLPSSARVRTYGTAAAVVIAVTLGLAFAHVLAAPTSAALAEGVTVATLSSSSSTADIIEFTQGAPRWTTIEAQGRIGVDGKFQSFDLVADRTKGEYRSLEGDTVFGRDAAGQYRYDTTTGTLSASPDVPAQSATEVAAAQARMAQAAAVDPTLARSGELFIATPLNDLVNPSYFVRRELVVAAESVTKANPSSIAGRQAVHLVVTFPKGLAKRITGRSMSIPRPASCSVSSWRPFPGTRATRSGSTDW